MSHRELNPEIEDPSAGGSSGEPRRNDERLPLPPPIEESGNSIAPRRIINYRSGTNKSCAACKFQRRKCSNECLLAPYFPADKAKTFSNAHRLFGVSNMLRILKQVPANDRGEAMTSIIFESDMRARYPTHGCYGIVLQYHHRVTELLKELHYVRSLLAHLRQQQEQHQQPPQNNNDHSNSALFPMDQYYSMSMMMPSTSQAVIPPHHNHHNNNNNDNNNNNNIFPAAAHEPYLLFNGNNVAGGGSVESKDNWINNFPHSVDAMMSNVGPNLNLDSLVPMDYDQSNDEEELDIPFANKSSEIIGSLGVQDLTVDDYYYNNEEDDDDAPLLHD